ncbi:MAG: hypothetical protein ACFCBW_10280 [Candidatus Competibacterales bacterium]
MAFARFDFGATMGLVKAMALLLLYTWFADYIIADVQGVWWAEQLGEVLQPSSG